MKKVKNWWMPVLFGALLMATLVGAAGARPQAASRTHMINVPPSSFVPEDDAVQYTNDGYYLRIDSGGNHCFLATVRFPTKKEVTVEKVRLYAYDENATEDVRLWLMRENPATGNEVIMSEVHSLGFSATDPRSFTDTSISGNPIKRAWQAYLLMCFDEWEDLGSPGVRIWYHTP